MLHVHKDRSGVIAHNPDMGGAPILIVWLLMLLGKSLDVVRLVLLMRLQALLASHLTSLGTFAL